MIKTLIIDAVTLFIKYRRYEFMFYETLFLIRYELLLNGRIRAAEFARRCKRLNKPGLDQILNNK